MVKKKSDWITELVDAWDKKELWDEKLRALLKNNRVLNPEPTLKEFQGLRLYPGFDHHKNDILKELLPAGDLPQAINGFSSFCSEYQAQHHKPFDFSKKQMSSLVKIFGWSDFQSRLLTRYPNLADVALDSEWLFKPKKLKLMLEELQTRLRAQKNLQTEDLKKIIRQYKYQELLRISIKDLGKIGNLKDNWAELSDLATACLRISLIAAYQIAHGEQNLDFTKKPPKDSDYPFVVMAMGKLGGDELNFSSDIDLFYLHDDSECEDTEIQHRQKLRKTINRLLVEFMADKTAEGFVCRVDLRLRPGGETAPLFCSVSSAESYYAFEGKLWERQALIRSKPVAGDLAVGKEFQQMIRPFVFSRSVDEHTLDEAKEIKKRIEKEHLKENYLNVKLGIGGIREIEFFVQCFQLLYGGHKEELRTANTLKVIRHLRELKILGPKDTKTLSDAYKFLRRLEHRLQMAEELQTHNLPTDPHRQIGLARSLGYLEKDRDTARRHLLQDAKDVMTKVRSIFSSLFEEDHLKTVASLKNSTRFHVFTPDVEQLFDDFARQLNILFKQTDSPQLYTRFLRLIDNIGPRLEFYKFLKKHPSILNRISRIAETSDFLWNYLLNHLDLIYQLDSSEVLHTQSDWDKQLKKSLSRTKDEEEMVDHLREFKHGIIFLTGSAELDSILTYEQARTRLTGLAEVILQNAFELAKKFLAKRFGPIKMKGGKASFAVIGMGKLGGREMTYHSDLDLIFVYHATGTLVSKKFSSIQEYYSKLVHRMISILTVYTRLGFVYKLDTRLRPSGNAGAIVTSLESYLQYHRTSQPWEHQALIKSRIVAGDLDADWIQDLQKGIEQATYFWEVPPDLGEKIQHLRIRKEREIAKETKRKKSMKEGFGGLLDIEYLTQYLQLSHGTKTPQIRSNKTLSALREMASVGILEMEQAQVLIQGYKFLGRLESYLRLLNDTATSQLNFDEIDEEVVLQLFRRKGEEVEDLYQYYLETTRKVREIYNQFLGQEQAPPDKD